MVSQILQIHSYDVLGVGRHTGYSLITIDENGNKTIETIDFSSEEGISGANSLIEFGKNAAKEIIIADKDNPNLQKNVYWSENATAESISDKNLYIISGLATGQSAQDAFNKIKLNAVLTNIANQIEYDIVTWNKRVCNTATSYWGQQYVPGFSSDIFDSLPGSYLGKDDDYVNASGYKQAEKIKAIEKLVDILLRFGNIEDILTNDEPYLSEKYLSILEPYLQQEVFSSSDEPSLIEIVRSISLEIISLPMMNFINFIPTVIKNITKTITTAEAQVSPLVIDLDGDGIETTSVANGVYFDHDGNGFSEKSAWAGKDDGLLVRDINGNGQIDNGSELFGNNTILSNGQKAANGFEALKDLDSNNDGVFNSSDTAWNEVKVWKDTNQNGKVDEGELLTLEQANIESIDLNYSHQFGSDEYGNEIPQRSTVTKTDGSKDAVVDVWFNSDYMDSLDNSNIEISDEIMALPEIQGLGNAHSLRKSMVLNTTLKTLVEQYVAESNIENKDAILMNIIYEWTAAKDIAPNYFNNGYGDLIDARKVFALEYFMGREYSNDYWGRDIYPEAAEFLNTAFQELKDYIQSELDRQLHLKPILEKIYLTWNETNQKWEADVSAAIDEIQKLFNENLNGGILSVLSLEKVIKLQGVCSEEIFNAFRESSENLTTNDMYYYLYNFGKYINHITDNADIVKGSDGNDTINGLGGDDRIFGGAGDDTLIGGAGNDYLVGGEGSDTYFFEGSWGHDAIENTSDDAKGEHPDTILFGEGIVPADVTVARNLNDLVLSLHDGADKITVYGYFVEGGTTTQTVDYVKFADGTTWTYDDVRSIWWNNPLTEGPLTTKEGTDANDYMNGTTGNDLLLGRDGNDNINGKGGSDIFVGGKGDDTLTGGVNNDTYVWNLGDGLDTISDGGGNDIISFGKGISFSDLTFRYVDGNLKIMVNGDENQGVLIKQFFYIRNTNYKIEDIRFFDGSVFHLSDVGLTFTQTNGDETVNGTGFDDIIYGNGGNDTINGGDGDDIIIGGKGIDILTTSTGDDVYVWNRGDGLDLCDYSVLTHGGQDTIRFGAGISFSDLTFKVLSGRNGDEMNIIVDGDETQGIRYRASNNDIAKLEFADGTIFNLTANGLTYQQTNDNETILGTDFADVIYANGGDDIIYAQGGDTIYGGKGSDTYYLKSGENTIVYNRGDGLDTITKTGYAGGNSKVLFGEGISMSDLTFFMSPDNYGYDLHIILNGDKSQGIIIKEFRSLRQYIDVLEFADGTVFKFSENGLVFNQTELREEINGTDFADVINAGNGDDRILTYNGNDIVNAGKGNDTVENGSGEKTFIYNLGDGMDKISMNYGSTGDCKIVFGEGITAADLSFVRMNSDLYVYVKDRSQGMLLDGHFYYGERVKTLEFSDGTTVALTDFEYTTETYNNGQIQGTAEDDVIVGNHLDNYITAGEGNNTVTGGKGNDDIRSGSGDDVFIYNLGDGADSITDAGGSDKIVFGEGISQSDITFRRDNDDDLLIVIKGDVSQSIKIDSFFRKDIYVVETLEFADGSTMNLSETGLTFTLSQGDNYMRGATAYDDVVYGGESHDTIITDTGNDIIVGGKGNDQLQGGVGNDTYVWNLGDGFDTISDVYGENKIVFGEGISFNDLTFTKIGQYGLRIIVNGDESQGMLISSFFQKAEYRIKSIEFADGSSFNLGSSGLTLHQTDNSEDIYGGNTNFDNTVYAGDGHDNISVGNGNNTFIGGRGNDTITGGAGNDTYIYNLGDGFDTIYESGGNDKIVFGEGISQSDLSFEQIGNHLKISINDDEIKGIQINNQFSSSSKRVETIEFADGSTLDISNADQLIQAMNSFSLSNSASADTLSDPTQDVSEMYSLAASELNTKAA